jgi:hypothetical protein
MDQERNSQPPEWRISGRIMEWKARLSGSSGLVEHFLHRFHNNQSARQNGERQRIPHWSEREYASTTGNCFIERNGDANGDEQRESSKKPWNNPGLVAKLNTDNSSNSSDPSDPRNRVKWR